jgi:hypothetical protein
VVRFENPYYIATVTCFESHEEACYVVSRGPDHGSFGVFIFGISIVTVLFMGVHFIKKKCSNTIVVVTIAIPSDKNAGSNWTQTDGIQNAYGWSERLDIHIGHLYISLARSKCY